MISYSDAFNPPAPVLELSIRSPVDPHQRTSVRALLDTGADITVVPEAVVVSLGLTPFANIDIEGYDGLSQERPLYMIALQVVDVKLAQLPVIAYQGAYALLGRDVLNQFYTHLHGPDLTFDLARSRESE